MFKITFVTIEHVIVNLAFLTTISIFDIKTRTAPNFLTIPYLITSLIATTYNPNGAIAGLINFLEFVAIIIVMSIYSVLSNRRVLEMFGGGDIKTIFGFSLTNTFYSFNLSLIFASVLGITYAILSRKKGVPFIPFLLVGYILSLITLSLIPSDSKTIITPPPIIVHP